MGRRSLQISGRLQMPLKDLDARKAYQKAKYAANKSLIRAKNDAWKRANPEKYAASIAKWHADHPERVREIKRKYATTNRKPDAPMSAARRRLAYEKHKARHPEAVRMNNQRRRSGVAERTPAWDRELDALVFREAARLAVSREQVTGDKWEIDHIVPLKGKLVSGLHVWNNLQVVQKTANRRKSNAFQPQ